MAKPNECDLQRVFIQVPPKMVEQNHVPYNVGFNVVIQTEVGSTLFETRGAYQVIIVVRDLSASTTVLPLTTLSGNFGSSSWPTLGNTFVFAIPPQPPSMEHHIFQAITVTKTVNSTVNFLESDLFIITHP